MGDNNMEPGAASTPEENTCVGNNIVQVAGSAVIITSVFHNFNKYKGETGSRLQVVSSGTTNGIQFSMSVYPKGFDKKNEDYMGISLLFMPHIGCGDKIKAMASVHISDHFKTDAPNLGQFFKSTDTTYTWKNMRLFKLSDLSKKFLKPDDELKIVCRVYAPSSTYIRLGNEAATTEIDKVALRLFNDVKFNDITIIAGEQSFPAHKAILAAHSSTFATMFEYHKEVLPIGDLNGEAMRELLRFIYMGRVENIEKFSQQLLAAAEEYDIQGLKSLCEMALSVDIDIDNVVEMLILGHLHRAKQLETHAIEFLWLHMNEIKDTEKYQLLMKKYPEIFANSFARLAMQTPC